MPAIFDAPVMKILPALTATKRRGAVHRVHMGRGQAMVPIATRSRDEWLPNLAEMDDARRALWRALGESLDAASATEMLMMLYERLGVKAGGETDNLLLAALDLFGADEIARATGMWKPNDVTPAALALAARKLIATSIYPPKPAELLAACREAGKVIAGAHATAQDYVDNTIEADAILLLHAHDEWQRPYQTLPYRLLLAHILNLHWIEADTECVGIGEDAPLPPYAAAVEREQAKLTALAAPPPQLKIAAARKRQHVKRS